MSTVSKSPTRIALELKPGSAERNKRREEHGEWKAPRAYTFIGSGGVAFWSASLGAFEQFSKIDIPLVDPKVAFAVAAASAGVSALTFSDRAARFVGRALNV